jgi:uncharacterized membrane protein
MQLANSNYSIKVNNYSKRTPETLKLVADLLLVLIPFVETISLTCPDFTGKKWVFWGIITVFSLFKIVSKFVSDHTVSSD